MTPTHTKLRRNPSAADPHCAENRFTRPPPIETPSPIASICTIEKRLLPLPASSCERPLSVTLFIAANCMELAAPNTARITIPTIIGVPRVINANATIEEPTITVLTSRNVS